jgi:MFS family permease
MIAFALWGRRPIATANMVTLLSGMAVIGLTTFLPMYVQGVLNRSALVAGFALTMMVLGWPIGATVAARNVSRFGLRRTMLLGATLLPIGALAFLALGPGSSPMVAGLGSLVMGLGMGFVSNAAIMIIQTSAGWAERGSATASNVFSRNLGSTLGAAILGAVLNVSLAHGQAGGAAVSPDQIKQLLDHAGGAVAEAGVRLALSQSLHITFWAIFAAATATLLLAILVPQVSASESPSRR